MYRSKRIILPKPHSGVVLVLAMHTGMLAIQTLEVTSSMYTGMGEVAVSCRSAYEEQHAGYNRTKTRPDLHKTNTQVTIESQQGLLSFQCVFSIPSQSQGDSPDDYVELPQTFTQDHHRCRTVALHRSSEKWDTRCTVEWWQRHGRMAVDSFRRNYLQQQWQQLLLCRLQRCWL